ncbi:hypothetical protein LH67_13265 [Xenorhabdus nematophila]|nr:hypothetical protein LH67_13265 [Xenorhabdus nematophila]
MIADGENQTTVVMDIMTAPGIVTVPVIQTGIITNLIPVQMVLTSTKFILATTLIRYQAQHQAWVMGKLSILPTHTSC